MVNENANEGASKSKINLFDVIIIGAGAAGLMCAATAGGRGRKVLLLDHSKSVGEKIRISGGGRCNFTNLNVFPKNFISQNPHFCVSALKRFTQSDFLTLVKKHKIAFHEKTLGQLFCDISSKQIIQMLLDECALGSVEIRLETKVKSVKKVADLFEIEVGSQVIKCQSLVIATGGLSIPKMGASGFGYDVARQFGLKIVQPAPALVPLTLNQTDLAKTKNLAGVSVDAIVTCGKTGFREAILFTHRGLSGPAILQISSYFKRGQKEDNKISINFAPNFAKDSDFLAKLQEEKKLKPKQELSSFLASFLPKSLANYLGEEISKKVDIKGNLADLSNQKMQEISKFVTALEFYPSGSEGFEKAEVTMGGVCVDEISSKNFEAKSVSGLFFIGEVLDVTGHLGGFNFQWAWSSGKAAGDFV